MILILKMEDGTTKQFGIGDSVQSLIRAIEKNEVETIVVGAVKGATVLWEKQFQVVDVVPTDFGKRGA